MSFASSLHKNKIIQLFRPLKFPLKASSAFREKESSESSEFRIDTIHTHTHLLSLFCSLFFLSQGSGTVSGISGLGTLSSRICSGVVFIFFSTTFLKFVGRFPFFPHESEYRIWRRNEIPTSLIAHRIFHLEI